jgi:hypothetical protein
MGSRNGVCLSEEAQCRGPLGEGSLTEDPGRYVKKGSGYGHLSIGAPLGNLEGIRLPGLFREKDSISRFLSWTQRILRF